MIYILATQDIIPGKMAEYLAFGPERAQTQQKVGMKLVGQWRGYSGDANRVYSLYAYNDLAEFQRMHDARDKNADYQKMAVKTQVLLTHSSWVFIDPLAWSPMK
jgi:hypothetical protein